VSRPHDSYMWHVMRKSAIHDIVHCSGMTHTCHMGHLALQWKLMVTSTATVSFSRRTLFSGVN
jgi:hypothetical protein